MERKPKDIVKTTTNGRMFVETADFLKQEKVMNMIGDLKNSSIVKDIERRKRLN